MHVGPAGRTYYKGPCGTFLLLRLIVGSFMPRVLPWALVGAAYAAILHESIACNVWPTFCENAHPEFEVQDRPFLFVHTYAYQATLVASGFGLVFRLNQSLVRYWEARTASQNAAAKWTDGVLMSLAFDEETELSEAKQCPEFARCVVHLASLLHAVALHMLRGDRTLDTLLPRCVGAAGASAAESTEPSLSVCDSWRGSERANAAFAARNPLSVLGGVTHAERQRLASTAERVHVVLGWLTRLLVRRRKSGGLAHDAPIVSRIYQVFSDGTLWYMAALKVVDTPFPFPLARECRGTLGTRHPSEHTRASAASAAWPLGTRICVRAPDQLPPPPPPPRARHVVAFCVLGGGKGLWNSRRASHLHRPHLVHRICISPTSCIASASPPPRASLTH